MGLFSSLLPIGAGILGSAMGGKEPTAELKPWDAAAPYAEDVMGQAQTLYGQGAMNPLQMLGLQNQLGFSSGYSPQMIGAAMGGWGQMLDPWSFGPMADAYAAASQMSQGGINPYGQQLMSDVAGNMTQSFQESVLPQIAGNAVAEGAFGGSRQAINESLASQRFNQELGTAQNQLAAELYRQGLGQQQAGVNALSNLGATGYNTIGSAVSGLGGMLGAGMWPGQSMYDIGGIYQSAPWNQLNRYNAAITPYASVGSVGMQPDMMSRVGGELLGYGLGNLFAGMNAPGNTGYWGTNEAGLLQNIPG